MTSHPADRFFKYVDKSGDCHLWTGGKSGRFGIFNVVPEVSSAPAQKFAYELANGPLAPWSVVTQNCGNPLCVNPDHLIAYSRQEAQKVGLAGGRSTATHCVAGHPLEGENLIFSSKGRRVCRECANRRKAEYRARKKA